MPNADFEKGTKVCQHTECDLAGVPQPLANFDKDGQCADGLRHLCKKCRNRQRYGEKKETNAAKLQGTTLMLATAALHPSRSPAKRVTHVEELAGNMLHAFGGVERMSTEFAQVVRASKNDNAKIRGFQAVFQLARDASVIQGDRDQDMSLATDEEIQERMLELATLVKERQTIDAEFEVTESPEAEPEREAISPTASEPPLDATFTPPGALA